MQKHKSFLGILRCILRICITNHPVRLLHPYLDVWHMKGPLAEKAVAKITAKTLC
jgi:hypothetical protein